MSMRESEPLRNHKKMCEQRLKQMKWQRGMSEKRILDFVNSPEAYRTKRKGV